jgi:hypothetical protein
MRQLMSGEAAWAAGAGSANAKAVVRLATVMSELDFMVSPPVGGPSSSVHGSDERRGKTMETLQAGVWEVGNA